MLNSSGTVFNDYRKVKLTVPYGYEFKNKQQVVDFLVSYERYLIAQGFTFNDRDGDLGETRNFKLSVKEFLFWAQQGWKTGTLLVMSPVTNSITLTTVGNIVDEITDSQHGSKIVDQNFNLVRNTGYQILRSPTGFKVTLADDNVLGLVELNLVQYEHVLTFDNTTVFNDVIYKPELGNRQYRLKLIGQKTAAWDGSLYAPGFVYNSETVQTWQSGRDYLKGELVLFKDQYYVALTNVPAAVDFDFTTWKLLAASEIKTGLLRNFSTLAVGSQSFYDSYGDLRDNDQLAYSHGLIGFKPRQYLSDLGVSDTTQIEFYKGYIRQKGSTNAVDALTKAGFNNLSGNISLYEEWAVRTGEYGALTSNPYIEIALDERAFSVNPAVAEFVDTGDSNFGDGLTIFNMTVKTQQISPSQGITMLDSSRFSFESSGSSAHSVTDATFHIKKGTISISPQSVSAIGGKVYIRPSDLLDIKPTAVGTMDNVDIGQTTHKKGKFTDLVATTSVQINPTTLGTIDNVNIGVTTTGTGRFSTLEAVTTMTVPIGTQPTTVSQTVTSTSLAATPGTVDVVCPLKTPDGWLSINGKKVPYYN